MLRMSKCLAIDRYYAGCRNNSICESRFCKLHQYMNDYTVEMLEKLDLCGGCKKAYWFEGETKTCVNCRERGKINRLKTKESIVLCNKEGCKFKRSTENEYCVKHQLCIFENETKAMNKKLCANYIRGCRAQLEMDYKYSKCGECLEIARIIDHKRRENAITMNNKLENIKHCLTCFKELSTEKFIGINGLETKTCSNCREQNRIQDTKRDKEHRNEIARNNIYEKYRSYVKDAPVRKIIFSLSYEEFISIVKNPCYYCDYIDKRGFNGIDRYDSAKGYILENCNSCCQMCNYMKGTLNHNVFIHRIEHILVYQGKIQGKLYPGVFANHKRGTYKQYRASAITRNLEFAITEKEFNDITNMDCYICGKENTTDNKNGLDRYNNDIGYKNNNIRGCCAECNYMKMDYNFHEMIDKFVLIYEKHKDKLLDNTSDKLRVSRFS